MSVCPLFTKNRSRHWGVLGALQHTSKHCTLFSVYSPRPMMDDGFNIGLSSSVLAVDLGKDGGGLLG